MTNFTNITLGFTAISTALIAGLFYAYSCSVNPGLGKLPDKEYIAAMQSINLAIINPVFILSFMGTLILLPLCTYLHYARPFPARFVLLGIASLIYITGTFGITILGNVPLNDTLASYDIKAASINEIADQRIKFEVPWNRLHTIRTVAAVTALSLVIIACLYDHKNS
ncbi:anthrone oxygenase family protein [Dyadobacter frigoris]|uniref:DUF1772 domain-containing protein n=1 Tax=Dyadobacter frigoris TaxID=2576211 RepID=A0A4U6D7X4_9BACT|nr:anthrone oxygenase family protein [Dyadobacter frigoris]TKT92337.1 DUF1772 domain-containing protein [Dyadobacter frigoris]GLU53522.1 membrane protein [Dyadobacter frigoris]